MKQLLKIPLAQPRRPYEDGKPNGYLESDRDWFENNSDACLWFLNNAEAIRAALDELTELKEILSAYLKRDSRDGRQPERKNLREHLKSLIEK